MSSETAAEISASRPLRRTILVVLLAASGCSAPPANLPPVQTPGASLAWPAPPAPARIRYVRSVARPQDWGIAKSGFRRFLDAITGQADIHFVRPTGVAERADVLFVADPGARALFILDAARNRLVQVNRLGKDTLVSPVAVALGPADTVFLADSWLKKVFAVDHEGKLRHIVASGGLVRPAALAYDAAGARLYVADSVAHQILVYSADGRHLTTFGSNGREDGQFNSPTHLAIAADGNLLVTDALNFRIQVFDPMGNFLRKMGRHGDGAGDLAAPKGVAADSLGHIYVADALLNAVQIFNRDGALLLGVGELGTRPGQFSLPGGLFIGLSDRLYVADSYNQRIQVFQYLAGSATEDRP